MSATIFRNVSPCKFACYASLCKARKNKINIAYELFVLFDHFLPL